MTGGSAKIEVKNKKGGGMLRILKNNCNFAPQKIWTYLSFAK